MRFQPALIKKIGMKRCCFLIFLLLMSIYGKSQITYTLDDCRRMATTHNNEVKIANEKVNEAESLNKAAKTQYLPSFSASGGYVRNQKNISLLGSDQYLPVYTTSTDGTVNFAKSVNNSWTIVNGSPTPLDANGVPFNPTKNPEKIIWKNLAYIPKSAFEFDSRNIYAGSIMMTQPLFMGGKILELNRIAESSKKIAKASMEGKISETLLNTDEAYWRIVSLVNKEKLAKKYVELLKKIDCDLEKSVEIGVATKSDVLTVKVKLNESEMSLLQVQDGLSLSRMALCQICGLPLDSEFKLADEDFESTLSTESNFATQNANVENRYEVKSLEEAVKIADANKKIMMSRFLPNAALTAGYITSNPNMYNGFQDKFDGQFQVGIAVTVPIFHWGERIHTLKSAQNAKNIAQFQLEDAKEKIELDITQATFKSREAVKKVKITTTNMDKANENLKYANLGFDSGIITTSTLLEAQTAWLKANSDNIDAQIDVQLCNVYLKKALGDLK